MIRDTTFPMAQFQHEMNSEVGPLYLVASEKGLRRVAWTRQPAPMLRDLDAATPEAGYLRQARRELTEYFAGRRREFGVALDVAGSEFQRRVWEQLRAIPYGATLSYKQVADKLESKATRAVGSANGRNPVCIVAPCHRVIASDGSLGGFSGGLATKEYLLALERKHARGASLPTSAGPASLG